MAKSFETLSQLEQFIKSQVKESAKDLGKYIAEETKQQIDNDIYQSYSPSVYERTYELKESIKSKTEKESKNNIEIVIEHDENAMHHTSIVTGENVGSELADWIQRGQVPNIFNNNSYPWTQPRPYMENTVEKLENNKGHVKELKRLLRQKGIDSE